MSEEEALSEARAAWIAEGRGVAGGAARDALLALVMGTGVVSALAIAWRVALAFDEPHRAYGSLALAGLSVAALAAAFVRVARVDRLRIDREVDRARARSVCSLCPRCGGDGMEASSEGTCGVCGARLLRAEGLLIVHLDDEPLRLARWRAAARHQLRHVRPNLALAPPLWLGAAFFALAVIVAGAHSLGGAIALPAPMEASVGQPRESADDGVASARGVNPAPLGGESGEPTRPRAPLLVGTQVLAGTPRGAFYALAVIVRVREQDAFVVYADGDSAWVESSRVLAPEIAAADAVEMFDGARFTPGIVRARLGSALLVDGAWSSVSRLRLRLDGAHTLGEGRSSEVPPGAWVEARVDGAWRPGISVDTIGLRQRVVLGHGSARWFDAASVRPQQLGPGARVRVDGRAEEQIIAARIGHALAIVGPDGARSWTALSRVRRR